MAELAIGDAARPELQVEQGRIAVGGHD